MQVIDCFITLTKKGWHQGFFVEGGGYKFFNTVIKKMDETALLNMSAYCGCVVLKATQVGTCACMQL